jgi:predicted TIM-barrel fold metal-dependent hydrolase
MLVSLGGVSQPSSAQDSAAWPLSEFRPRSQLRLPETKLSHAKFPVIDVHTHFRIKTGGTVEELRSYLEIMEQQGIVMSLSLDATLGREDEHLAFLGVGGERLRALVHLDFRGAGVLDKPETWAVNRPGFIRDCVERLKIARQRGVVGVKFFKDFGLTLKDARGELWRIDDPYFAPLWEACGELKLPIIIHTADPLAFFEPIDGRNERLEELLRHPDWSFHGPEFPTHAELMEARNRLCERHPQTIFIGAHLAGLGEDLSQLGQWLEQYPNLYVDIASRIGELGRQPRAARKFLITYRNQILFGTDGPWPEQRLKYYWRFLETADEYFPYSEKSPPPQGLWNIYGVELPDETLKKIYFENACRLFQLPLPEAEEKK